MLSNISEKKMHVVRYVLVIGWLLLILSLFYDPISHYLTDPNNLASPLRDQVINRANDPNTCVRVQGECLTDSPYPIATRIFWGMTVPSAIAIVFIFGHETWRRICPLYFLSQIPRALGLQPKLKINKNNWLLENHLYLQFILLFIGLNFRILFINSARPVFGLFLILTILSAITIVYLYGGRSWCHYVCPFGMVQMVFTGPRGLIASEAHTAAPKTVTQSMCRTFDQNTGQEKITCISCKSPCMDIDAEKAYWQQLTKPGRKLVQYGYLGLVVGYFVYYRLYAGNFDYYFSGAWTHEENQLSTIFKPGFYLFNQPIPIPKLIATPLTIGACVFLLCLICTQLQKAYTVYLRRNNPYIDRELILHRVFSLCTFVAFNAFYVYGGRPEILRLPPIVQLIFNGLVVLISTLWLYRTWGRNLEEYKKESIADKLRRQLKKLDIDFTKILKNRSLDQLKPDELDILAQVLPEVTRRSTLQDRLQVYKGVLQESLQAANIQAANSLKMLEHLRQQLNISEQEHYTLLTELGIEDPTLIKPEEEFTQEDRYRLESYREAIAALLQELVDSGMPLSEAIRLKTRQIQNLKREYRITKQEHFQILGGIFDSVRPKAEGFLSLLEVEASRYRVLSNLQSQGQTPVFVLLRKLLRAKQLLIVTPLLAILEMLNHDPDGIQLARRTGILANEVVSEILQDTTAGWQQRLSREILQELQPSNPVAPEEITTLYSDASDSIISSVHPEVVEDTLLQLLQEPNPITQAASIYALVQVNPQKGKAEANQLLTNPFLDDLVRETAAILAGQSRSSTSVLEQLLSLSRQDTFELMSPEKLLSWVKQAQRQGEDLTQISPRR
jgi:hypothetical protein